MSAAQENVAQAEAPLDVDPVVAHPTSDSIEGGLDEQGELPSNSKAQKQKIALLEQHLASALDQKEQDKD